MDMNAAIQFVLRQEDETMSGIITNALNDRGGRTRWGVAETSHPELTATGFFDTMSNDESLAVAETVYDHDYASPLLLQQVNSQAVAQCLLSFAINEGVGTAAKVVQQGINYYLAGTVPRIADIQVDGHVGPGTLGMLNSIGVASLLTSLRQVQLAHYEAIIAADPTQAKWRNGWRNRTIADTTGQLS